MLLNVIDTHREEIADKNRPVRAYLVAHICAQAQNCHEMLHVLYGGVAKYIKRMNIFILEYIWPKKQVAIGSLMIYMRALIKLTFIANGEIFASRG